MGFQRMSLHLQARTILLPEHLLGVNHYAYIVYFSILSFWRFFSGVLHTWLQNFHKFWFNLIFFQNSILYEIFSLILHLLHKGTHMNILAASFQWFSLCIRISPGNEISKLYRTPYVVL